VRELRNLCERLSIFAAGREILPEDFPSSIPVGPAAVAPAARAAAAAPAGATLDLQQIERQTIERALERFSGNRSAAAEALGISRRTLQRKLKEYAIHEQNGAPDEA
jgi:DNA-binding NtrC family response regulator